MLKYQELANTIRDAIQKGAFAPGDKIGTEFELSEQYHLSRQTVRNAIDVLEKEKLIYRIQGSGTYVSDQTIPVPKTKNIGVISTYINDYIFPDIIRGIQQHLSAAGYSLTLSATENHILQERTILEGYLKTPVDGLIIEGTKTALPNPNLGLYRQLKNNGVPILFIHGYYPQLTDIPYVMTDDRAGGELATQYLIDHGHTKIAGIFSAEDLQGQERFAGYLSSHLKNHLPFDEDRILWFHGHARQYLDRLNIEYFLNMLHQCTAILCYNDIIALSVSDLAAKNGIRIPEDLAVISFDNSVYSDLSPKKLTTLDHPKEKLGACAVEQLLRLIQGETISPVLLPWVLKEKESV